ncbi:MAG: histidine phosphatase family protein [Acidimicrobiia bacterium]|nr:histidine phosphatase family protein [Acidimicrobiia bacterium]
MDLFLVRHGQPAWSTPDRLALNDPSLTDLGIEQSRRVAHRLGSLSKVDNLWVSSMARALETADAIEAEVEPDREVFDWLQEINNPPEWEGTPVEKIDRHFETLNLRSMDEMWNGLGPGGESFRDFHERVVQGLRETLDSHGVHPIDDGNNLWNVDNPDQRVVIVGHAGANAVILGHLLGLDPVPWEWERFRQPHTGVSRITTLRIADGWAFSLRQLGSVSHLHPGMVTV